jgi:dihydrofolate reductase
MISLLVAIGKNNVIGKNGKIPWSLPADMKHFVELTRGKSVIMGRKTFESIGKPLPHRKNIIISSNFHAEGCTVVSSIEDALKASDSEEVMIIGGASIYEQFLPLSDKMYITFVDYNGPGDTFFPKIDPAIWKEVYREFNKKDEKNAYDYAFVTFERRE